MISLWGRPGILPRVAVGTVLLAFLMQVVPLVPAIANRLADRWDDPRGEVLVVLGADMVGDGTLGMGSYWRAVYGVRAYRKHPFRKVIVCGGAAGSNRSVAAAMAEFMQALGVPREVLVLEGKSRSTRENALFTKELLPGESRRVVLVTSDFHMWRSRRVFEKVGMEVVAMPFPDVGKRWSGWTQRWQCGWDVSGELVKIGYYWMKGWI